MIRIGKIHVKQDYVNAIFHVIGVVENGALRMAEFKATRSSYIRKRREGLYERLVTFERVA